MFTKVAGCGLMALAMGAAVFGQKVEGPTFEVASVKAAAPMTNGRIMIGPPRGGPGTADPGHVTATNVSLKDLLTSAYEVKRYQVSGPDWLDGQRFDIQAKVPEGATKEQVAVMWQNLLKERFGLSLHHETKELPMYALVIGKNGPKLKESVDDPNAPPPGQGPSLGGRGGPGGPDGGPPLPPPPPTIGKDGMLQLPAAMRRPGSLFMMGMNGRMRLVGTRVQLTSLTENLGRQFDRPVLDQTGLTQFYDITLDFSPEGSPMRGMPGPPPGAMMAPPPGGAGGMGGDGMRPPEGGEAPTLMVALQEQLGLKLEAKKGPVDLLVIDHIEKMPTEN